MGVASDMRGHSNRRHGGERADGSLSLACGGASLPTSSRPLGGSFWISSLFVKCASAEYPPEVWALSQSCHWWLWKRIFELRIVMDHGSPVFFQNILAFFEKKCFFPLEMSNVKNR